MRVNDVISFAFSAIKAQPKRAALILLAMSIGVASVTLLTALGESARRYIVDEFQALGTNLLIVLPGRNETTGGQPPMFGETPRDLTLQDALAISRSRFVAAMAPLTIGSAPVSTGGLEREADIMGSTAALRRVRHLQLSQGRFLPQADADKAMPVCIIGHTLRRELFRQRPALGQWIRIDDRRFRVIGVLSSEGQSIGVNFDEMVIIPVASAQALFNNASLFRILLEIRSQEVMQAAVEDVTRIVKQRHEGEDDITLITQDSVVNTFDQILIALTFTVSGIASISLAVSGILVMNVMLVTVTQRTAEIGLLKALGAANKQLKWLFLSEAALLSLAGALSGFLLGQVLLWVLQWLYPDFPVFLPAWAIVAAFAVALGTGLLFGILPAMKAAKQDPIQALVKR